jgi:hypothetical protein
VFTVSPQPLIFVMGTCVVLNGGSRAMRKGFCARRTGSFQYRMQPNAILTNVGQSMVSV